MTVDLWREGLIRPDRYVAMRELLCPLCGKTGHVAGDCDRRVMVPLGCGHDAEVPSREVHVRLQWCASCKRLRAPVSVPGQTDTGEGP